MNYEVATIYDIICIKHTEGIALYKKIIHSSVLDICLRDACL